jgi:hypothetical protein
MWSASHAEVASYRQIYISFIWNLILVIFIQRQPLWPFIIIDSNSFILCNILLS